MQVKVLQWTGFNSKNWYLSKFTIWSLCWPVAPSPPSDLRHSGERPVGRHDGQREVVAVVSEDGGGIPGSALRQLHHQLEGWQALQRHHTQTQVSLILNKSRTWSWDHQLWWVESNLSNKMFTRCLRLLSKRKGNVMTPACTVILTQGDYLRKDAMHTCCTGAFFRPEQLAWTWVPVTP